MKSLLLFLLLLAPATLAAQVGQPGPAETIRGHVASDSARPIVAATVIVTRGPDRRTERTTTDSAGNFRVHFDTGTGDYLVYAAATGYKPARRRVQRQGAEREIVANFTLVLDLTTLATTKVTAPKPVRANNSVGPMQPDPGASEKWSDGINGQIPPTVAGDLTAIAGTMSNVTVTGGGVSILGSDPSGTLVTMNGMASAAASIPRATRSDTRVTGATFDATRGGFSGAAIDTRPAQGNRNYEERSGYFSLDPTSLQFTDPTSRALGAASGGFRVSAAADGELVRDALTYNTSIDVRRAVGDPATLLSADPDLLLRAGASPDSVARLLTTARLAGVPLTGANSPSNREHRNATWLTRLDDTRDSLDHRMLTTYVSYTTDGALGFGALAAPSAAGQRQQTSLGAQFVQDNFVGPGRRVLDESRFSVGDTKTQQSPYQALPGANVLIDSPDPTAPGGQDVDMVTLGGAPGLASDNTNWFGEAANEIDWFALGNRHRFRALAWARVDGLTQSANSNQYGYYTFNSLADFAANTPSTFTRTLTQPPRTGQVWNSALAFSHTFVPSQFVSFIYGARVEGDGFFGAPAQNPALEQALGVATGAAPFRVHVSPRIGFTYRYNRDRDNGNGMAMNNVGRFFRSAFGVVRGGIGEFRDLLTPGVLANAKAATGLSNGTSVLSCVGSAVPLPNWNRFVADPSSIPTTCADTTGPLAERATAVNLVNPSYDVPRSWRASLDWSTAFGSWLTQISTLASYNLNQPGVMDANFGGAQQFTLADGSNRPVFVTPASIDPATGALSASTARRSTEFGAVDERVSDLKGYGGQVTFRVSPDLFKFRSRFQLYTSLSYTLQKVRSQFRGFDGAGFGDPRTIEWAPSNYDARHVLVLSAGLGVPRVGTFTAFSRLQSGLPFTPIVQGDINGDGVSGDRAFIPNPATTKDSVVAAQLRSLLANGSSTAKDCISTYLGQVVPRNGCRGPWTQTFNVQWSPYVPQKWANRVTPTVYFNNVPAGLDQLLHGSAGLRGWGSPATPNPTLLVPRGYSTSAQAFLYTVNQRFADTRPGHSLLFNPFQIIVDFRVDLTTNPDLQQLRRAVEPVRGPAGWIRRSSDSLTAFYLRQTSSVYKLVLSESDSLFLTSSQTLALRRADSTFSARVIAVYGPLGEYLAKGEGAAGPAELDSVVATQKLYWKSFWEQPEIVADIITAEQRELIPLVKNLVSVPKENREHSRFLFGSPVTIPKKAPPVPVVPERN
jgi:Carboxypeptidase regulatory-like domain